MKWSVRLWQQNGSVCVRQVKQQGYERHPVIGDQSITDQLVFNRARNDKSERLRGHKAEPKWEGVHHLVGLAILKAG
jgi:hypothetical protein